MALRIFICGAETLTAPAPQFDGAGVFVGFDNEANAARYRQLLDFLTFELDALARASMLSALAYQDDSHLACVLSAVPMPMTPVKIKQAIKKFGAQYIFVVGGGTKQDPDKKAAIDALIHDAQAANIPIRDASNLG